MTNLRSVDDDRCKVIIIPHLALWESGADDFKEISTDFHAKMHVSYDANPEVSCMKRMWLSDDSIFSIKLFRITL